MPGPSALFITADAVGARMGGNAIRAYELARAATPHAAVTLAAPAGDGPAPPGVTHVAYEPSDPVALRRAIAAADVVVAAPQSTVVSGWLRRSRAALIYDLYDPAPLETLEIFASASRTRRRLWATLAVDQLLDALHSGHRFICATERQRDLWLGAMVASRLISPEAYDADPSLRAVIDVVPFGVPAEPPGPSAPGAGIRARFPQIAAGDEIVLWNGGIWNWLDPVTAVDAAAELAARRPRARLVFMGRPPVAEADGREAGAARDRAAERELLDRVVFFNDAWVPYDERSAWLLEADCALSTHHDNLETRFAFRTRLLDCLWAGLPVVCTGGDELGERIAREGLGAVTPAGDATAVAAGLERVLDRGREAYAPALATAAAELSWPSAAAPLIAYLAAREHPRPLGAPWDRRSARPLQRARALGIRAGRGAARIVSGRDRGAS